MKAALGTFDVAATVDKVSLEGVGENHMILSSPLLSALNRQLQLVTYTNTVFHPKTADTGKEYILSTVYLVNTILIGKAKCHFQFSTQNAFTFWAYISLPLTDFC